jgi:hypothetical protein
MSRPRFRNRTQDKVRKLDAEERQQRRYSAIAEPWGVDVTTMTLEECASFKVIGGLYAGERVDFVYHEHRDYLDWYIKAFPYSRIGRVYRQYLAWKSVD